MGRGNLASLSSSISQTVARMSEATCGSPGYRGVYHRAALRADPLARNDEDVTPRSRGGDSPEFCNLVSLWKGRGRRECRAPAAPAASWAEKGRRPTSVVTTGEAERSALPAQWLYGLLRALPGVPGLLAPVPPGLNPGIDPSVGGSGPHGLTVRAAAARLTVRGASIASRATCRSDRETPSVVGAGRIRFIIILFFVNRFIFLPRS